ncbi:hypothetical protein N2152v2_010597 [Parachlorella kessleri]
MSIIDQNWKRLIRAIVRRIHPDLFASHPFELNRNSESLKVLNAYVDQLSRGMRPPAAKVEFFVKDGAVLTPIRADLPAYGSLGPLFLAFGLISQEELAAGVGSCSLGGVNDRDFLQWLNETVAEAVVAAEQHESMKKVLRDVRAAVESRYRLNTVQLGGEFAVSLAEQRRQIEALKVLDESLAHLCANDPGRFEGLSVRLYHPDSCPLDPLSFTDANGAFNVRTENMNSHVADDGCLHIVADRDNIGQVVASLDLARARLLSRLSLFWIRRSRGLAWALQDALGVRHVWSDTRSEHSSQRFVLWAGAVLERKRDFQELLQGRLFSFSLLVHSDSGSPMLDFLPSSSVLQVRSDCPPSHLMDFLKSEAGQAADSAAAQVAGSKQQEEQLLEAVRAALGAKHVIRVCSSYEQDKVIAAAQRLLESAPVIRTYVDLSGASLAIDDCYEVWESGFISIPYDFTLSELRPKLQALLGGGSPASVTGTAPNGTGAQTSLNGSPASANGAARSTRSGGGANGAAAPNGSSSNGFGAGRGGSRSGSSSNGSSARAAAGRSQAHQPRAVAVHKAPSMPAWQRPARPVLGRLPGMGALRRVALRAWRPREHPAAASVFS